MKNPADIVADIPSPVKKIADVASENEDNSDAEKQKNSLIAELIREKIHRDVQRKNHRKIVFVAVTTVCFVFYCVFISLIAHVYCDIGILQNTPMLWVVPLLALATVPTILLVMLVLALYRKRPEEVPNVAMRLLENLSKMAK